MDRIPMTKMDELEWLEYRKKMVVRQMESSRARMHKGYEQLTGKEQVPSGKWGKTAYLLSKSGTIINGIRLGLKIGTAVSTLLKLKRAFSKKC